MEPHFWHAFYEKTSRPPISDDSPSVGYTTDNPDSADYTMIMQTEDGTHTTERPIQGANTALDAMRCGRRILLSSGYDFGLVRFRGERLCGWPVVARSM